MKSLIIIFVLLISVGAAFFLSRINTNRVISGAPPYQIADNPPEDGENDDFVQDWTRPAGPPKVALQVGHWKTDEVPEELQKLRGNTGASGGGKSEWEVNYVIAEMTKEILETKGIEVELLPTTIPENYWADVFVSIHADGNLDTNKSGFKAAVPRRDLTGNADELLAFVEDSYQESTKLEKDPNVTRNMRGYYAFGWWRYSHSINPMTTALILETGFLSSPSDRNVIVDNPQLSAQGLANGIIQYLSSQKVI